MHKVEVRSGDKSLSSLFYEVIWKNSIKFEIKKLLCTRRFLLNDFFHFFWRPSSSCHTKIIDDKMLIAIKLEPDKLQILSAQLFEALKQANTIILNGRSFSSKYSPNASLQEITNSLRSFQCQAIQRGPRGCSRHNNSTILSAHAWRWILRGSFWLNWLFWRRYRRHWPIRRDIGWWGEIYVSSSC